MKKNIHPKYYNNTIITCSCGAVFKTGSTREKMQVEICSACHPFYTGKKKIVDITGRVGRFKKLAEKATAKKEAVRKAKTVRSAKGSPRFGPPRQAIGETGEAGIKEKAKKKSAR